MSVSMLEKYPIKPLNQQAMDKAQERLDDLVKPPGSLGELEAIAKRLAGISGEIYNDIRKRCVIIMASDNGVVEEGVAAAPQIVTTIQTLNFVKGITGVAVFAKEFDTDLIVVDVGINEELDHPMVVNKKIRKSTGNIAHEPAMTYEEAIQAVLVGIEMATKAVNDGYKIIGVGEMGIGNTTTSSAVLCALTGLAPQLVTGRGAGLKEEAYRHKIDVVRSAICRHQPNPEDPFDVLAKVGGFDIAAMAGLYVGAAHQGIPVVIDGYISMVAALCASKMNPLVKEYMIASHASAEPGYSYAADALGVTPYLNLKMRLGEGSGCPLMFAIIDAACVAICEIATFEEADIGGEYLENLA